MDDEYIIPRLLKWVPLFYGKWNEKYAFAYSEEDSEYFCFGYKRKHTTVLNRVNRAVAIFLATHHIIQPKKEQPIKRRRLK